MNVNLSSIVTSRLQLFNGCLVMALLGAAYAGFNVVGASVGQFKHISTSSVATIAYAGVLGSWLHLINGPFVTKYGPLKAIGVGIVLWVIGFFSMANDMLTKPATTTGGVHPSLTTTQKLSLFNFLGMQGASFITMASLSLVPLLFPSAYHTTVMGVMGAAFALGQVFVSTVYSTILRHMSLPSHFFVFLTCGILVTFRGSMSIWHRRQLISGLYQQRENHHHHHHHAASSSSIISNSKNTSGEQQRDHLGMVGPVGKNEENNSSEPLPLSIYEQHGIRWFRIGLFILSLLFFVAQISQILSFSSSNEGSMNVPEKKVAESTTSSAETNSRSNFLSLSTILSIDNNAVGGTLLFSFVVLLAFVVFFSFGETLFRCWTPFGRQYFSEALQRQKEAKEKMEEQQEENERNEIAIMKEKRKEEEEVTEQQNNVFSPTTAYFLSNTATSTGQNSSPSTIVATSMTVAQHRGAANSMLMMGSAWNNASPLCASIPAYPPPPVSPISNIVESSLVNEHPRPSVFPSSAFVAAPTSTDKSNLLTDNNCSSGAEGNPVMSDRHIATSTNPSSSSGLSVLQMLKRFDLWIMFMSYFCCAGLASALNAIAASIVAASYPNVDQARGKNFPVPIPGALRMTGELYAMAALARCWGGLVIGVVHNCLLQRQQNNIIRNQQQLPQSPQQQRGGGYSAMKLCLCCHFLNIFAYFLLLVTLSENRASAATKELSSSSSFYVSEGKEKVLYFTIPLINFVWGTLYTTSQVTAIEAFGLQHFPSLWGILSSSPCISTYLFSVWIAGAAVDEARESSSYYVHGHPSCLGAEHCFQKVFVYFFLFAVIGGVSFGALVFFRGGAGGGETEKQRDHGRITT